MNCREYIVVATLLAICASAVGFVTEKAAPVVETEDLWSKPDGGIRGRLVVETGAPFNGTSQVQVYLELQNVSDVANSIHITPARSMSFDLVDAKGNVVKPDAGMSLDVSTPDDPLGLVLPHQGTLRFLVSVTGIGVPKDKKWQVSVPHESSFRSWVIERTDENPYFLSGLFKATAERQVGCTWSVALSLPKVAVAPSGDDQTLGAAASYGHGPGKSQTTQLRMSISTLHQNVDGKFTFRLALENIGVHDIILNLGTMLANGKVHLPDAIRLILTDAKGESRELHFSDRRYPFVGGRVDDYSVPLRAGSSYSIKVSLDDYWSPDTKEHRLNLPPGAYRIRAEFTGSGARHINLDTQGMKLMNFWRGTLRSDETGFVVRKRGAASSPNVEIKIESDRRTFTVDEPITVTITIKNLTSQDLEAPETYWSASVVLDGKEFKRLPEHIGRWNGPGVILRNGGEMRTVLALSEYGISQEFLTVGEHSIRVKIGDDLSNTLDVAIRQPVPNTILIGQTERFKVHGIAPSAARLYAASISLTKEKLTQSQLAEVQLDSALLGVRLVTATHNETGAMHILAYTGNSVQRPTRRPTYGHSILTGVVKRGEYLFIATLTADRTSNKSPLKSYKSERNKFATRVEVIALSDLRLVGTHNVPVAPIPDYDMSAFEGGVLRAYETGVRLEDWHIEIDTDGMIVVKHLEEQNDAR